MTRRWVGPVGVVAVTVAVFAQTLTFDFLRAWDDGAMLLLNAHLTSWDWPFMLQSIAFGHWMPLTWLTWTVDAHLWGLWAGGWHAVNVLLHAGNALLVYLIAVRLLGSRWASVAAALLFSVHPMRMESVAWITERKDLLSGCFVLLAILAYLRYVERRSRRWFWYALCLLAFVAACLSKSIAVILPVWLLLLDWAVLNRRAWIEKAPFVFLAGVVSEMAFYAVHVGVHNLLPWETAGLGPRLLHVAYSNVYYLWRTVWPSRLSHMIEYTWVPSWSQPEYPVAVVLVVLTGVALVLLGRRWLTAAALAYAVAILPQSGLFQNGPQLLGNRYSYLACLPVALLAGAGCVAAARRLPRLVPGTAVAAIAAFAVVTMVSLPAIWRDDATLWTYAAEAEPTCTMCQDWAGVFAYKRGDLQATRRYFERAIPISNNTVFPRYERWWGYAKVLEELGEPAQAAVARRTYLASIPAEYQIYEADQRHMQDARVQLARFEAAR